MKRLMFKRCLLALAAVLGMSVVAQAEEPVKVGQPKQVEPVVKMECGNDNGCGPRLAAGLDLLLLRPHFDSNQAQSIDLDLTDSSLIVFKEFEYDWSLSPRIWVAAENESGLGVRLRFFHFDQSADAIVTTVQGGVNGASSEAVVGNLNLENGSGVLETNTSLYIQNWDAEITKGGKLGQSQITLAGGLRYSFQQQTYDVLSSQGGDLNAILSTSGFTGVGPTVAVDAVRPVGDGNLALYGNARCSLLYGRGHQTAVFAGGEAPFRGDARRFDTEGILEAEIGIQFVRDSGNFEVLIRPALVSQLYMSGGNARGVTDDFGRVSNSDFGLVGLALTVGVGF